MIKKIWLLVFLVFSLWIFVACAIPDVANGNETNEIEGEVVGQDSEIDSEAQEESEDSEVTETVVDGSQKPIDRVADEEGVNLGNIANSNFWVFQGNELFYPANFDLGIYNLDSGLVSKVEYHAGHYPYIAGNDYYFSHITGIRRADLKTGEYIQLSHEGGRYINVVGDWVYFVNNKDDDRVYRMKTDGSEMQQLSTMYDVRGLLAYKGYLYFNPYSEYNKLYRMKDDGSDLTMINEQWIPFFMIYKDELYMTQHGEYGIFKSALDGSGKTKLTDYYGGYFNILNDYIFYNNEVEGYQLYRMKTDGSDNVLWLPQSVIYTCVNEGYLYFFNDKDPEMRVHRMYYDSKELEVLNLPHQIE